MNALNCSVAYLHFMWFHQLPVSGNYCRFSILMTATHSNSRMMLFVLPLIWSPPPPTPQLLFKLQTHQRRKSQPSPVFPLMRMQPLCFWLNHQDIFDPGVNKLMHVESRSTNGPRGRQREWQGGRQRKEGKLICNSSHLALASWGGGAKATVGAVRAWRRALAAIRFN